MPSGTSVTIASGGHTEEHKAQAYGLIFGSVQRTTGSSGSVVVTPVVWDSYPSQGQEVPPSH